MSVIALVISALFGGIAILYARKSGIHAGRSASASEDAAIEAKRSANAAEMSALEMSRASADQRTPKVVLTWLPRPELRQRWNLNLSTWNPLVVDASPTVATPRGTYVSPVQDWVFVSVAVRIHIENKSDTPVKIQIDTLDDTVLVFREQWFDVTTEPELTNARTGEITIDPLLGIDVRIFCGVTVANWFAGGKATGQTSFNIHISADYEPDGATLNWNLGVGASLLEPSASNNSGAVLASNLPPDVNLRPALRSYGDRTT